jgi:predicted GIY-YIG superfamily endonuclease
MKNNFYVYIITNKNRTTLYTGLTNDLHRRVNVIISIKIVTTKQNILTPAFYFA